MRRQDSAAAVAAMDQPAVLRQLRPRWIGKDWLAALGGPSDRSFTDWTIFRTRLQTRAPAACDRATRATVFTNRNSARAGTVNAGTGLHLRRAHEERQALLATRPRSSALLAAQRPAGDATGGKVSDQRV